MIFTAGLWDSAGGENQLLSLIWTLLKLIIESMSKVIKFPSNNSQYVIMKNENGYFVAL